MIGDLKVLAVVPARGGSKGVPRKNIRTVAGMPLIGHTLRAAGRSRYIDRTVLSSEDDEIIEVFRTLGGDVPFRRPDALAADDTPGLDPLLHACRQVPGHDLVVLLQPTSPLRTAEDIDRCIEAAVGAGRPTPSLAVVEERHGVHLLHTTDAEGRLKRLLPELADVSRRQDAPPVVRISGAVYVAWVDDLLAGEPLLSDRTVGVPIPESRSLDIDTEDDLRLAELLIASSGAEG